MNVELLRKVEKHILEEPKRLYMSKWIRRVKQHELLDQAGNPREYASCGTAACIAGWAVILNNEPFDEREPDFFNPSPIFEKARTILQLTEPEAIRLFEPLHWPTQFYVGLADDGSKIAAETTVRRIEHFIDTEGQDSEVRGM